MVHLGIKKSGDDNPHNKYKSFMKYARLDSEQIDYLTLTELTLLISFKKNVLG